MLASHLHSTSDVLAAEMLSGLLAAGWLHQTASVVAHIPKSSREFVFKEMSVADVEALQQCFVVLGRGEEAVGIAAVLAGKLAEGRRGLQGIVFHQPPAPAHVLSVSYDGMTAEVMQHPGWRTLVRV